MATSNSLPASSDSPNPAEIIMNPRVFLFSDKVVTVCKQNRAGIAKIAKSTFGKSSIVLKQVNP